MPTTDIDVDTYVEVSYEKDNGRVDSLRGQVIEVDTDPDANINDRLIKIDEGEPNQHVLYCEGTIDGESYTSVERYSEFSGTFHLGNKASIAPLVTDK